MKQVVSDYEVNKYFSSLSAHAGLERENKIIYLYLSSVLHPLTLELFLLFIKSPNVSTGVHLADYLTSCNFSQEAEMCNQTIKQ